MSLLEKLSDGRYSVLGKLVSVLVTVVLICSFLGTPAFAAAATEEISSTSTTTQEFTPAVDTFTEELPTDPGSSGTSVDTGTSDPGSYGQDTNDPGSGASDTDDPGSLGADDPGSDTPSADDPGSYEPAGGQPEDAPGTIELDTPIVVSSDYTVIVGKTITLRSDFRNGHDHQWLSDKDGIVTIEGQGSNCLVTGNQPGDVKITHTYKTGNGNGNGQGSQKSETFIVTVKQNHELLITAQTDKSDYKPGETATITVTVKNNGNTTVNDTTVTANPTVTFENTGAFTLTPESQPATLTGTYAIPADAEPGTTTITLTANGTDETGSLNAETTANITVLDASEGATAYFYIWKPDADANGNYTQTWAYAQTGKVINGLGEATSHNKGDTFDISNVATYPAASEMPVMQHDGQDYTYDPDGGPGTYMVKWEYIIVSDGYNIGGTSHDVGLTYHVDGQCVFRPNLTVTKTVTGATGWDGKAQVNDTLKYTITVTNNGNADYKDAVLTDVFKVNGKEKPITLTYNGEAYNNEKFTVKPGAENAQVFTGEYKVTDADETLSNVATVSEISSSTVTTVVAKPNLEVTKIVEGASGDNGTARVGDVLTYTITVTNNGNYECVGAKLTDEFTVDGAHNGLGIYFNDELYDGHGFAINVGDTKTFTSTYKVRPTDNVIVNTATVGNASSTVTTQVESKGALTVKKTVEGATGSLVGGVQNAQVGDELVYTITVTNTGNAAVEDVKLSDVFTVDGEAVELSLTGDVAQGENGTFAVPESGTVTFTSAPYTVRATDVTIENTAIARSETAGGASYTVKTPVDLSEVLSVTKTVSGATGANGMAVMGDELTYKIVVTNEGNTTIHTSGLTDVFSVNGVAEELGLSIGDVAYELGAPFDIEKGQSVTFTSGTYTVGAQDGAVVNTATVNGAADSVETLVVAAPAWTVEKVATTVKADGNVLENATEVGDTLNYTVTVTNTGNVELTDLNLVDTFTVNGEVTGALTAGNGNVNPSNFAVAVGESVDFNYSYTVQNGDTTISNVATVGDVSSETVATEVVPAETDTDTDNQNPDNPYYPPVNPDNNPDNNPNNPDNPPVNPENPDVPNVPEGPETPETPDAPDAPDTPTDPSEPEGPVVPPADTTPTPPNTPTDTTPTTPDGPTTNAVDAPTFVAPILADAVPLGTLAVAISDTAAAPVAEAIGDNATPLAAETIGDDATPLAGGVDEECWLHWVMLAGLAATVVYAAGVVIRRGRNSRKLHRMDHSVTGGPRERQTTPGRTVDPNYQTV